MIVALRYSCAMSNIARIHQGKTPQRLHFIPEWAEYRGMKQADIVKGIGADKGLVSKWFAGTVPSDKWIEPLAEALKTDPSGLFRHPDDDWLARFFRQRSADERERAITMLEAAFPDIRKRG